MVQSTPKCSKTRGNVSRSLAMVEVEQSAKSRPTLDATIRPIVVAGRHRGRDEHATKPLMESLGVVVGDELAKQMAKVAFAEDDEVPKARG